MPNRASLSGLCLLITVLTGLTQAAPTLGKQRLLAERLARSGDITQACVLYQELVLNPANTGPLAGDDLTLALQLLRRQNKIRELDAFRDRIQTLHSQNRYICETLAYDYLNDPYHWGYVLDNRYYRGAGRIGNAQPVCSFARDRTRCLQLLANALSLMKPDEKDSLYGVFCLKAADALVVNQSITQPALLETKTDLKSLPPFEPGHERRYELPDISNYKFPTGFTGYQKPARWDAARTDGERWRFLLADAAQYGHKKKALTAVADFYRQILGVQRYTHVSPDSVDAFKAQCKQLADAETLVVTENQIRLLTLVDDMNYLKLYKDAKANDRLVSVYAARGQLKNAAEFLSPQERVDWQSTTFEFIKTGPLLPSTPPAVPIAYRNSGTLTLRARPVDFDAVWQQSSLYLRSKPRVLNREDFLFSTLGKRVLENNDRLLGKETAKWTVELPESAPFERARTTLTLPFQNPGLFLLEGSTSSGQRCRRIVHLTDLAVVRKNLAEGVWLHVVSLKTGKPIAGATVDLMGYYKVFDTGLVHVRSKTMQRTTNETGEVMLSVDDLSDDSGKTLQWAVRASHNGHVAYLDFSPFPPRSHMERPINVPRAHIMTNHRLYKPGDHVTYRAWLAIAGFADTPQMPWADQKVVAVINDPSKKKVFSAKHLSDAQGNLQGSYHLPDTAVPGTYYLYIPEAAATLPFTVADIQPVFPEADIHIPSTTVEPGSTVAVTLSVKSSRTYAKPYFLQFTVTRNLGNQTADADTVMEHTDTIPPGALADDRLEWKKVIALPTAAKINATYTLTAELTDGNSGYAREKQVIAHQTPGAVNLVLDKHHYTADTPISVMLKTSLHGGFPAAGRGLLEVIQYTESEKAKTREHVIHTTPIDLGSDGIQHVTLPALPAGRYHVNALVVPDISLSHFRIPMIFGGGLVFIPPDVRFSQGAYNPSSSMRGNTDLVIHQKGRVPGPMPKQLTLIPDKQAYAPGETMKLLILSPVPNATIAVFTRPAIAYEPPQFIALTGGSGMVDIKVNESDRPNMFIECMVVGNGRSYNAVNQVTVLPGNQALILTAELPDTVGIGTQVNVPIKVMGTNPDTPVKLMAVVHSQRDDSVEPAPGISQQLRPWVRRHQPATTATYDQQLGTLYKRGETPMAQLEFTFLKPDSKPLLPENPMADTEAELTPLIHRSHTPKTLFWGELATTKAGEATLSFKAPNTASAWTLKIWALSPSIAGGEWQQDFLVQSPLRLNVRLPSVVRVGDRFVSQLTVKNQQSDTDFIAATIEPSDGLDLSSPIDKGIRLAAGEQKTLLPVFIARKPGTHTVSTQIIGTEGEQRVRQQVHVLAPAVPVATSKQQAAFCLETTETVSFPAETSQVSWAVGVSGVLLQMNHHTTTYTGIVPDQSLAGLLVEATTLNTLKAVGYSVLTDSKKETDAVYWNLDGLKRRAEDAMLKLASRQNSDGGWSWSGAPNAPSSPQTTAEIVHDLQMMRRNGLPISRGVLFKAIQFLRGYRDQRMVLMQRNTLSCSDIDATIFLALIESKDRGREMIPVLEHAFDGLAFPAKCQFVLGLLRIHYYEKYGPLMAKLRQAVKKSDDDDLAYIDSTTPLRDTAEFIQIVSLAEPGSDLLKSMARWLILQRKTVYSWGNSYIDGLCLDALASYAKQADDEKPALTVLPSDNEVKNPLLAVTTTTPYTQLTGTLKLPATKKPPAWRVNGYGDLFLSYPNPPESVPGIETSVSFATEAGRTRGFQLGDLIDTMITVKTDRRLEHVGLSIDLPAGLIPLTAGHHVIASGPMSYNHRNGNRIIFLEPSLDTGEHTIHFRAIATYSGTFAWNSPQLYENNVPLNHKKRRMGSCSIGLSPAKTGKH